MYSVYSSKCIDQTDLGKSEIHAIVTPKVASDNGNYRTRGQQLGIRRISYWPSAKATSALFAPLPVAATTNCRPERVRYVIGTAVFW